MRVAVVGATGNIGFHLVYALLGRPEVDEIVGIARRLPTDRVDPRVRWVSLDISRSDSVDGLAAAFTGCRAVVNLAWLIQPERRPEVTAATNIDGLLHVLSALTRSGSGVLVAASSVGSYAPGPKSTPVGEDWPTTGVASSAYSRQKAAVERILDGFETAHPECRVIRMRPGFVLSHRAAASQVRYFVGPLLPRRILRSGHLPLVPAIRGLAFQVVHSADAGEAFAAAVLAAQRGTAQGAYNIAADPLIASSTLAEALGGRPVPVPASLARMLVRLAHLARIIPIGVGWFDLAMSAPCMDTGRARAELGWRPTVDARDTLREWVRAAAVGEGAGTPVLRPAPTGWDQVRGGVRSLTGAGAGRI